MDANWIPKTFTILQSFYELNPFPYLAMGAWMLFSIWYVRKAFKDYANINRYVLQLIPFVFTALGLLGAVAASLGFVWGFTPEDLLSGSTALFKGLLGAAVTAITGIALSLIFGKLISMTHYKIEMRKALENNELFVLKKMLKLLLKAYAKEQHNVNRTLESLKGVRRDVKDLGPDLDRNAEQLQESLIGALKTETDAPLSVEINRMRQEFLQHTRVLLQQGKRQNELLERIAGSLDPEQEHSVSRQLAVIREEQRSRSTVLETGMGSIYESLQRLDTKQAAESVRIAVQDQTRAVKQALRQAAQASEEQAKTQLQTLETMQQAHSQRMEHLEKLQQSSLHQSKELADQQERKLEAVQNTLQQAHAARLDELAQLQHDTARELSKGQQQGVRAQQQTLDALKAMDARNSKALEELLARNRRQARELAALAKQLDPEVQGTLPLALQDMQNRLQNLSNSLGHSHEELLQGLAQQGGLMQDTREALLNELAGQQAAAAAKAAEQAAERFDKDLAPRIAGAVSHLEASLDDLGRRQEDAALQTAEKAAATVSSRTAKLAAQELRRHQAGQFGGLSRQLQQLADQVQKSLRGLAELGTQTKELSADAAGLREMLQQAQAARSSIQDISSLLTQLTPQGEDGAAAAAAGLEGAMQQLVQRLQQVDAIKRSDLKFWRQVERQMHDGIPIIMGGNKLDLRDDLNGSFQDRLQRSFNNLDKILQTIVSGYQRRSEDLQ